MFSAAGISLKAQNQVIRVLKSKTPKPINQKPGLSLYPYNKLKKPMIRLERKRKKTVAITTKIVTKVIGPKKTLF